MIPAHQKTSDKKRVAALVCQAIAIARAEPGTKVFNSIDTAAGRGNASARNPGERMKKFLVAGASGLVGMSVLRQSAVNPEITPIALLRKPLRSGN